MTDEKFKEIAVTILISIITILSFVAVIFIILIFSRPFCCVLEYRMTEATVALVVGLAAGAGLSLIEVTSLPLVRKTIRCLYVGIASALILCVLVVKFSPPPMKSDCAYLFTPTPVIATPTPSPTSIAMVASPSPTSTSTPSLTATGTATPTGMATHTPTRTDTLTDMPTPVEPLTGKIAFPIYQDNQKYIYLAKLDGAEPTLKRLTRDASEPALSPDGSQIAFRSWNDATRGLMVMNVNNPYPRRVSRALEDASPCWALGESLVFHSSKEGPTPRLYTVGTWEGAEMVDSVLDVRRGTEPVYGQYPAWVPGGRVVYKYFERSGNFLGLWVMNSDGSNPMPITDHAGDTMPSVSPNGDRVAFMSDRTGKREVYVVNIDGSGLGQLTDSSGYNNGLPTWSPDGRYIAFVSERGNRWAVWVMNSDGSGERKLFDLDGTLTWGERISWGP